MYASCFPPTTPYLAEIVQRTGGTPETFQFQVWFGLSQRDGGIREPELTLVGSVTGRVLLEAAQRGTGAHLISCDLD